MASDAWVRGRRVRAMVVFVALCCLVILSGCQPAVYLMPTPVALAGGDFNPFERAGEADKDTQVPVLYATNRVPLGNPGKPVYTIFAGDLIRLGWARLRIGDDRFDFPALVALSTGAQTEGRPRLFLEQLDEWSALDVTDSKAPLPDSAQRYFDAVNSALAASADKDLMIYVHGANANVYRASAQAAQYRHSGGYLCHLRGPGIETAGGVRGTRAACGVAARRRHG
ncbi:MAG: hypothetical protein WBM58_01890 [Sedimenticolaceae bacterium]